MARFGAAASAIAPEPSTDAAPRAAAPATPAFSTSRRVGVEEAASLAISFSATTVLLRRMTSNDKKPRGLAVQPAPRHQRIGHYLPYYAGKDVGWRPIAAPRECRNPI